MADRALKTVSGCWTLRSDNSARSIRPPMGCKQETEMCRCSCTKMCIFNNIHMSRCLLGSALGLQTLSLIPRDLPNLLVVEPHRSRLSNFVLGRCVYYPRYLVPIRRVCTEFSLNIFHALSDPHSPFSCLWRLFTRCPCGLSSLVACRFVCVRCG